MGLVDAQGWKRSGYLEFGEETFVEAEGGVLGRAIVRTFVRPQHAC